MRKLFFFTILISGLLTAQPKGFFDRNAWPGYSSIDANDLRAHLSFLASDELEGRETTFRGQKVAARYIASWFSRLNLKPIGPGGSWFQPFELDVTKPDRASSIELAGGKGSRTFAFGKDFLTTSMLDTTISGTPVFAGFADSYRTPVEEAGLEGKVVVLLAGQRTPSDPAAPRSQRGMFRSFRNAAAIVVIIDERETSMEDLSRTLASILEKGSFALKGVPRRTASAPTVFAGPELGAALLEGTGKTIDRYRTELTADSAFRPQPLTRTPVSLNLKTSRETKRSENVVGLLEGSDPRLKDEVVVLTAHYDHVGIHPATGEIYNGADDDGSGTSMILELAEAFVTNPKKPARSILFMTVAGEEKGLLGSSYYASHPLLPLERTIANINMDMIGRIDKKHEQSDPYVYVIGSDKISTQLDSLLQVANRTTVQLSLDYEYNDDNDPNQFYRRSDHYNFARNGIPIIFFFTGVHEDYHRPTDTVEKIEFDRMVQIGRLMYATTWKVAHMPGMLRKDGKPSVYSRAQQ